MSDHDATAAVAHQALRTALEESSDRQQLWSRFLREEHLARIAEIGVFKGVFAAALLDACPEISEYTMVDPWRHLDDWNKPANREDDVFETFYQAAMSATEQHAAKRRVLRGRTTEVIDQVEDGSLDLAYIDGDHTLRGITIDLIALYPKVRHGGYLAGDDLTPYIWQHGSDFEPSMVFPFAAHFAEAMGHPFYALPYKQFLIHKDASQGFEYHDLTGKYPTTALLPQLAPHLVQPLGRKGKPLVDDEDGTASPSSKATGPATGPATGAATGKPTGTTSGGGLRSRVGAALRRARR